MANSILYGSLSVCERGIVLKLNSRAGTRSSIIINYIFVLWRTTPKKVLNTLFTALDVIIHRIFLVIEPS